MGKYLVWLILGIIAVVVFVFVFNEVKESARPLEMSPAELDRRERGEESDSDMVIITLEDERYHRHGCNRIFGATEYIPLELAKSKGVEPCPICFPEDHQSP